MTYFRLFQIPCIAGGGTWRARYLGEDGVDGDQPDQGEAGSRPPGLQSSNFRERHRHPRAGRVDPEGAPHHPHLHARKDRRGLRRKGGNRIRMGSLGVR